MGLLDKLDELELSDDQKELIRQEHEADIAPYQEQAQLASARARRQAVENEIKELGTLGFSDQPGLLAFVRRVYLSDDEQPGLVLMSDQDLELDGETATGARTREEVTAAGVLRKFIEMAKRADDGKLALSDQILASENVEDPPEEEEGGDDENKYKESRKRAAKMLGRPITRKSRNGSGGEEE